MTVMGFLVALPSKYDSTKAQILPRLEISSFQDTFSRILHAKISSPTLPSVQMNDALVGRNIGEFGKQRYKYSGLGGNTRGLSFEGVVCYYYCKPGHVIRDYKKLQN